MRKRLFIALLAFSLIGLRAQDFHPIEQKERAKLSEAVTTADMVEPQLAAYKQWDHLLNIVYQEIKAEVNPGYFSIIRNSQRAWITFRDARIQEINHFYYREMQGTMWYAPAAGERVKLVQDRVKELFNTYSMNTELVEQELWGLKDKWRAEEGMEEGTSLDIRSEFTTVWKQHGGPESQFQFYTCNTTRCAQGQSLSFL